MGRETISDLQVEHDAIKELTDSGVLKTDVDEVLAIRELLSEIPLGRDKGDQKAASVGSLASVYTVCGGDMKTFRKIATKAMEMAPGIGLTSDPTQVKKSGGVYTMALDLATINFLNSQVK